ncbi:TRADD-N-associated membrane domain-containing protein [Micromonospora taraxaci]|uniref:TRADD-N-associated membrane domain-containing protein n=1 Tax=Micromonospora taraxaci TaxID=1316803 RepID=UPI0033B56141
MDNDAAGNGRQAPEPPKGSPFKSWRHPASGRINKLSIVYFIVGGAGLAFLATQQAFPSLQEAIKVPTAIRTGILAISLTLLFTPILVTAVWFVVRSLGAKVDGDAASIRGRLAQDETERLNRLIAEIKSELSTLRIPRPLDSPARDEASLELVRAMIARLGNDESEGANHALAREYGSVGLSQAKIAFTTSLVAAGVGFAVIIAGAVSAFFASATQAAIPVSAGGIISAISALFFSQATQTRNLMKNLLDEEQANRRFDESLTLAREIKDPTIQSRLQAVLSLNFADVSEKAELFKAVIEGQSATSPSSAGVWPQVNQEIPQQKAEQ